MVTSLKQWITDNKPYKHLPFFIFWGLWRIRNECIFEQVNPDINRTCVKISTYFLEFGPFEDRVPLPVRLLRLVWDNFPAGFFDGASARGKCGSGTSIYLSMGKFYHFVWYSEGGSNTRTELLATWVVLFCTRWIDIEDIYIFGGSKVVADWANGKSTMQTSDLTNWQNRFNLLLKDGLNLTHLQGYKTMKQTNFAKRDVRQNQARSIIELMFMVSLTGLVLSLFDCSSHRSHFVVFIISDIFKR